MNEAVLRAAACEVRNAMLVSLPEECPHYEASPRFERRMRRMLKDPVGYTRKMLRPWYEKAARAAAMAAVTVGASVFLFAQLRPADIVYYFTGEAKGETLPCYTITDLPEGYAYAEESNDDGYRRIRYENADRKCISLEYSFMETGSAFWIHTENMTVCDISVNGCPGQVFLSSDPKEGSAVVWMDEGANIQFFIDAFADKSVLLHMAESVSLAKTEKP